MLKSSKGRITLLIIVVIVAFSCCCLLVFGSVKLKVFDKISEKLQAGSNNQVLEVGIEKCTDPDGCSLVFSSMLPLYLDSDEEYLVAKLTNKAGPGWDFYILGINFPPETDRAECISSPYPTTAPGKSATIKCRLPVSATTMCVQVQFVDQTDQPTTTICGDIPVGGN